MIASRRLLCGAAVLAVSLSLFPSGAYTRTDAGVESAQRKLTEIGFDPGAADGLMGPRTRRAIRAFQKANDLDVNGRLDAKTLRALFPPEYAGGKSGSGDGLLTYEKLGWRSPSNGTDTLSRFRRQTGSLEMKRSAKELIVPDGEGIYLIASGDTVPGFDCQPGRGRIEMEFMLGPGGPVVFRSLDDFGYCQLGFGILLEVGQRLSLSAGGGLKGGVVEVQARGLKYLEVSP